ncbi:MAG: hypothetical protein C0469_00085 [Cyanobacteria bacterium DS2.3.42]|nr:hypothetical protein [Cyanobacteria bacterium DS2.3.42]
MPSCGLLPGARPADDGTFALAVKRKPGEEPVFYARALRRNIERKIVERGAGPGRATHSWTSKIESSQ